jgi:hypothetical protein
MLNFQHESKLRCVATVNPPPSPRSPGRKSTRAPRNGQGHNSKHWNRRRLSAMLPLSCSPFPAIMDSGIACKAGLRCLEYASTICSGQSANRLTKMAAAGLQVRDDSDATQRTPRC